MRRRSPRAGAEAVEVRTREELEDVDGAGDPRRREHHDAEAAATEDLMEPLRRVRPKRSQFSAPARGRSCVARQVTNPEQESLGLMDIEVERNAYGRQLDSRIVHLEARRWKAANSRRSSSVLPSFGTSGRKRRCWHDTRATRCWLKQGRHMVATFHPELSQDDRIHRLFLDKVE